MTLTAPRSNEFKPKNFELVPEGTHVARLYQILHIGTVEDEYMGEKKMVDKIRLTFELSNERKEFREGEGEKPFSISKEMTFSMNEKAWLRKIIEGMLGVALSDDEAYAFDLEDVSGKPCLISVVHKTTKGGNKIAVIQSAAKLPKGTKEPEAFNEARILDVNTVTDEDLEKLPGFLREKLYASAEWKKRDAIEEDAAKDAEETIDPKVDIPF